MKECKPDAKCITCAGLLTCKICEAWLFADLPKNIIIEQREDGQRKQFYFFNEDKSVGMIEILKGEKK